MKLLQLGMVALTLAFTSACAASGGARESATISAEAARGVRLFRGDGRAASWAELVDAACAADAVFVGENHGHALGLASAAALFDDVLARQPRAALALEFFERDEQVHLDDYLSGVTDSEQFARASGRSSGNYPPGHRAMVDAAKRAGRPVHAANAPRRYVSLARREGYDFLRQLSDEQRRLFDVPLSLAGGRYRTDFDAVMTPAGTPASPEQQERLDAVFRSQQMWDWTMADSVVRALFAGERPVVHVVGNFHVNYRGGTLQALERKLPGVRTLVVSYVTAHAEALDEAHRERGDFVVYVGP